MLALGQCHGLVKLVDAATSEDKWGVQAHAGSKRAAVAISPNGSCVASVGFSDRQWKLWDSSDGALNMTEPAHDGSGGCTCSGYEPVRDTCALAPTTDMFVVEFSPCNNWIATGSDTGVLWLWDVRTGREVWRLQASEKELSSLSFSGDGKLLACGGISSMTHIVVVETGEMSKSWNAGAGGHFCPTNSNWLATASGYHLSLWDVNTETALWQIMSSHSNDQLQNFERFSPDGLSIATVHQNVYESDDSGDEDLEEPQHVRVVDAATGETKFALDHVVYASIHDVAFSVLTLNPQP